MNYQTLGLRIEQARKAAGLSLRQVATRMSVKPSTVEKWEEGSSEPRANKLLTLAGVLGVPVLWLLDGESPDGNDFAARVSETDATARKLHRAISMQHELAALLLEISADVALMQRDFDGVDEDADGELTGAAA